MRCSTSGPKKRQRKDTNYSSFLHHKTCCIIVYNVGYIIGGARHSDLGRLDNKLLKIQLKILALLH